MKEAEARTSTNPMGAIGQASNLHARVSSYASRWPANNTEQKTEDYANRTCRPDALLSHGPSSHGSCLDIGVLRLDSARRLRG